MRAFVAAMVGWSLLAIVLLLIDPGANFMLPTCGGMALQASTCQDQIQAYDLSYWFVHRLPELVLILVGYLALAIARVRRPRKTRRRRNLDHRHGFDPARRDALTRR